MKHGNYDYQLVRIELSISDFVQFLINVAKQLEISFIIHPFFVVKPKLPVRGITQKIVFILHSGGNKNKRNRISSGRYNVKRN